MSLRCGIYLGKSLIVRERKMPRQILANKKNYLFWRRNSCQENRRRTCVSIGNSCISNSSSGEILGRISSFGRPLKYPTEYPSLRLIKLVLWRIGRISEVKTQEVYILLENICLFHRVDFPDRALQEYF